MEKPSERTFSREARAEVPPESLSRELFSNALKLAANQGLIGPGGEELAEGRRAFAARLRDLVARLIVIDEIDATSRQEAVGVEP